MTPENDSEVELRKRVQEAVTSAPDTEEGFWLLNSLRAPDRMYDEDREAWEAARRVFRALPPLFLDLAAQVAWRFRGQIAQADVVDLLQTRLRGRESDWEEDWKKLRDEGATYLGYSEFRERRQRKALESGRDWPARFVFEVDRGDFAGSFSEFVIERLQRAVEDEIDRRSRERPRLGVVFVHGIGNQREGETLLGFAEPMVSWIRDWLQNLNLEFDRWQRWGQWSDRKEAYKEFGHTYLADTSLRNGQSDEPAHTMLRLPLLQERWLLAEAWWADEVYAPPTRRLVLWLAVVIPMLVLTHLSRMILWRTRGMQRRLRESRAGMLVLITGGIAGFVMTCVLGTVLALALQVVVLLLGLAAMVPLRRIRASVGRVLSLISTTLGDSMSFTDSPISRAAIITKVSRTIQFVAERSDIVAVVAHSQGAAIAHRSLQDEAPENVSLFVTLGAGVNKLGTLHNQGRRRLLFEMLALVMCLAPLFVLYSVTFWPFATSIEWWIGTFILFTYVTAWLQPLSESERADRLSLDPIRWIDFYSRRDPVSNGPMTLTENDAVESREISNFDSFLGDHTAYWRNRDEFIPALLRSLADIGGTKLFESEGAKWPDLEGSVRRRRWRVACLSLLRRTFAVGASLVIVFNWRRLGTLAQEEVLVGQLQLLGTWIDGWLGQPSGAAQTTLRLLGLGDTVRQLLTWLVGAGAVILSVAVWYTFGLLIWHWWNRNTMLLGSRRTSRGFLGGDPPSPRIVGLFAVVLFVLLFLPFLTATLLNLSPFAAGFMGGVGMLVVFFGSFVLDATLSTSLGPHRTFAPDHTPVLRYLIPVLGAIAVMAWLAIAGAISGSVMQPYQSLWSGLSALAATVQRTPTVLLPFALPGVWVTGVIQSSLKKVTEAD